MIDIRRQVVIFLPRLNTAADQMIHKGLTRIGGAIRLTARRSIKRSKKPSVAGTPPHTQTGKLRESILYAVEDKTVYIGPSMQMISKVGASHEHGLVEYGGKLKKPNWKIQIGGHGPIYNPKGKKKIDTVKVSFVKIYTRKQLNRIQQFVFSLPKEIRFKNIPFRVRKYPRRPFMLPALEKLRFKLPSYFSGLFR